jgi:uncharacterized protein YdhG (YjbR/CyaY superfamily)
MPVIDEYLKEIDPLQKEALERIRTIVKKALPDAEEVISYGMPGFKYKTKYLIGFAAFKDHLSIFPTSGPIEEISDKLKEFQTSKGTIQFTVDKPVPEALILEIIQHRVKNIS